MSTFPIYSILFLFLVSSCKSLRIPFQSVDDPLNENDRIERTHNFEYSPTKTFSPSQGRAEKGQDFWVTNGKSFVEEKLKRSENRNVAKNIILFIGDGMSVPTLAAARIFKGQRLHQSGEEQSLGFEKFPYVGLSKTYCVDSQVADSACSATAYLNGVKANIGTAGVTADVRRKDCEAMTNEKHHTSSIAEWAQRKGKAAGLVTTTRVTHASPSGVYAHIANRDWEYDEMVAEDGGDPNKCYDIAKQLVLNSPGNNLKVIPNDFYSPLLNGETTTKQRIHLSCGYIGCVLVIMGGGRGTFLPKTVKDPEYALQNVTGWRNDSLNLIDMWLEDKKKRNATSRFIWHRNDLFGLSKDTPDYLLGLFEPSHMKYHLHADPKTEPTLKEMLEVAITILKKESNGFFLFVEGGKIDLAHHDTRAQIALDETIEFDEAIMKAVDMTDEKDTLIVVTADHAHTMSFSGYPQRGSDIFTNLQPAFDNLTYSTLSYANGPGYKQNLTVPELRYDLSKDKMDKITYQFPATAPLEYETHGGDDVAVFARGPWAHLLTGNYEQNVIPLVMGYAARIGPAESIPRPSSCAAIYPSISVIFSTMIFCLLNKFILK